MPDTTSQLVATSRGVPPMVDSLGRWVNGATGRSAATVVATPHAPGTQPQPPRG